MYNNRNSNIGIFFIILIYSYKNKKIIINYKNINYISTIKHSKNNIIYINFNTNKRIYLYSHYFEEKKVVDVLWSYLKIEKIEKNYLLEKNYTSF